MTDSSRPIFQREDGLAVPAVSVDEMREVDRIAVEETGPTLLQMMEHAGFNLALTAIEMLGPDWRHRRILVFAGSGGNGGGGLSAARHLANRDTDVLAVLSAEPERAVGAVAQQLTTLAETSVRVVSPADPFDATAVDLVIDAVVGYSLAGAPRGPVRKLIEGVRAATVPVLSLDVPSGIDADTGDAPGIAVLPQVTLTLALPKRGLRADNAGDLWLADLGIPLAVFARAGVDFESPFRASGRTRLRYPGT